MGTAAAPELETLERQAVERAAVERAAARAGGKDRLQGLVVCEGWVRIFKAEGIEGAVLQGLDAVIDRGEMVAIVGASGSGKSTLLKVFSGLAAPTAGMARVASHDLLGISARLRLRYRRRTVGFVRQQTGRNLLPDLTAAENVALPMPLAGGPAGRGRWLRANQLLAMVGVGYCAGRKQMSGGQQQGVAVARALANEPRLLTVDVPTGQLDSETGW